MAITAATFVALTDKINRAFLAGRGNGDVDPTLGLTFGSGDNTAASGTGYGVYGVADEICEQTIIGCGDSQTIADILPTFLNVKLNSGYQKDFVAKWGQACKRLKQELVNLGISGVQTWDQYCSYMNTGAGGAWNALMCPDWAVLYNLVFIAASTAWNVYAPPAANMGEITLGGQFASGAVVNTSIYAGQGQIEVVVTGFAGSAAVVTATGQARASSGTLIAGRTWSTDVTGNGIFALTPAVVGDLCASVSGITVPGAITGGTFIVAGIPPAGRSYPPS